MMVFVMYGKVAMFFLSSVHLLFYEMIRDIMVCNLIETKQEMIL